MSRTAMVDVETNGIHYFRGTKLLEIVVVVVDTETLEPMGEPFHRVVHYEPAEVDTMYAEAVPFVQEMHTRTALWSRLSEDPDADYIENIDLELLAYLERFDNANRMSIGGNSVRLDANFMEEFLPRSYAFLRYQLLDVTSIGKAARHWFGVEPFRWSDEASADAHNPLTDVQQSIEELRYYKQSIAKAVLETVEWEYAWEADEEIRKNMSPRGPKIQIDGYFGTPEDIAAFPRGRRIRRRKAGEWEPADVDERSITCPRCGMTSYNPNDIREGYCGNCHDYTSPKVGVSET